MIKCRAPQTRKYWHNVLRNYSDEQVRNWLESTARGVAEGARTSDRRRHDWSIARACVIREARKRGLL